MKLTKEIRDKVAKELVEVRKTNENEGSDYFIMIMDMIQEDDKFEEDFNYIINKAKGDK